jgi:hypothetical protein
MDEMRTVAEGTMKNSSDLARAADQFTMVALPILAEIVRDEGPSIATIETQRDVIENGMKVTYTVSLRVDLVILDDEVANDQ